jgi:hypothetical protein
MVLSVIDDCKYSYSSLVYTTPARGASAKAPAHPHTWRGRGHLSVFRTSVYRLHASDVLLFDIDWCQRLIAAQWSIQCHNGGETARWSSLPPSYWHCAVVFLSGGIFRLAKIILTFETCQPAVTTLTSAWTEITGWLRKQSMSVCSAFLTSFYRAQTRAVSLTLESCHARLVMILRRTALHAAKMSRVKRSIHATTTD